MAIVPTVLSDWVPGPFVLNTKKCGRRAKFSGDCSVVERELPDEYGGGCVTYTANPLPLGQVWQITILQSTTRKWNSGLKVGVTTTVPYEVPDYLPYDGASNNEWYYRGNTLYHNHSSTNYSHLPNLDGFKVKNKVGLLLLLNGEFHLFFDGKHSAKVATGLPVDKLLFGAVDVIGKCTKVKSEILSGSAQQILKAALQEGSIPHRDDKFLIHGPGGVGKSSLIALFLGTKRDLIRISTPVATEPLRLTPIRDVSTSRFTAKWERVDYERLSHMIAHTSNELFLRTGYDGKEEEEGKGRENKAQIKVSDLPISTAAATNKEPNQKSEHINVGSRFLAKLSKLFNGSSSARLRRSAIPTQVQQSLTTSLEIDTDNIQGLFSKFLQDLQEKVRNAKDTNEVLLSHSIRIVDSGGQPQFHELIAIFLAHISGFISVFKLNEALSEHGEVVLYDDGQPVNDPYESYYSHEQVIRHDLQAIQSEAIQSGMEEMPNLAFVGTFLDEHHKCSETPDMKDKRLHSIITEMLPPDMQECVITPGGSLKKATFRINARNPSDQDFERVDQLKEALMSRSRVKPRDLPLKWHGLEVALHMLMEELKQQSLSRKECEFIADKLGFDPASLNAALDYLRELNIIAFYDVLPNVIFGSSQVILDKITELVRYSLELKRGCYIAGGSERRFVQQGIISLEFLESPALSKHYIKELFEPKDLLKVFISLLVVSEVAVNEYIVPSVLEVSSIYPFSPVLKGNMHSSFILHFPRNCPMFGIYCCTVSSLISDARWKLLTKSGEEVQVARNSITFAMPGGWKDFPGTLTVLDPLSSYFQVVLELPASLSSKDRSKLYSQIRNTCLAAVKKAMKTLHYEASPPEVSFLCPEQSPVCSRVPHPAIVVKSVNILKCSLEPCVSHSLTAEQKNWLPKATGFFGKLNPFKSKETSVKPLIVKSKVMFTQVEAIQGPPFSTTVTGRQTSIPESGDISDPEKSSSNTSTFEVVTSATTTTGEHTDETDTGERCGSKKKPSSDMPVLMEPAIMATMSGESFSKPATEKGTQGRVHLREEPSLQKPPLTRRQPHVPENGNPRKPFGSDPETSRTTDQAPSLPELLQLKIPQNVGAEYKIFGTFLLNDTTGTEVNSIEEEFRGKPKRIVTKILEEWLTGKGKPCTWQTLIKTLRDCEFTVLAMRVRYEYMVL